MKRLYSGRPSNLLLPERSACYLVFWGVNQSGGNIHKGMEWNPVKMEIQADTERERDKSIITIHPCFTLLLSLTRRASTCNQILAYVLSTTTGRCVNLFDPSTPAGRNSRWSHTSCKTVQYSLFPFTEPQSCQL